MPTFNILDQSTVQKRLAAETLLQLFRSSYFLKAAATDYDGKGYFSQGEQISLKMPKDEGEAEDYDPRSGSAASTSEPGYIIVPLTLEKLFTKGFPVYSSDANAETYIRDYSASNAASLRLSADNYMYNTGFRTYGHAASGVVNYAAAPPLQVVWGEDSSGNLADFNKSLLINANSVFDRANVPQGNRYAALSSSAKGAFLGDSVMVEGFVAASVGAGGLLTNGLPIGAMVDRYGFMVGGSNAIASQGAVADTGDGAATNAISAVVADTTVFFDANMATATPLGAVRLTLTSTANLSADVAVGKVCRLGVSNAKATAYGVIVRVDAANKYVWLVPYNDKGQKLIAAQITPGTDVFSIPELPSVNVGYHRQHLAYATRLLAPPTTGSGATVTTVRDESGVVMQMWKGDYKVDYFKETSRCSLLMGATPTDHRKACLMLSN